MKIYHNVTIMHDDKDIHIYGYDEDKESISKCLNFDAVLQKRIKKDPKEVFNDAKEGYSWSLNRLRHDKTGSRFFLVEMTYDEYDKWEREQKLRGK